MPEYEALLEEDLRDYSEGEEVYVVIKDEETFENTPVRAFVYETAKLQHMQDSPGSVSLKT